MRHLRLIAEIVGKARRDMPWPERVPLPDGSVQCSGLTEDEVNAFIASELVKAMAKMALPDDLVTDAARTIMESESDLSWVSPNDAQQKAMLNVHRSTAMIGFRAVLREFAKSG